MMPVGNNSANNNNTPAPGTSSAVAYKQLPIADIEAGGDCIVPLPDLEATQNSGLISYIKSKINVENVPRMIQILQATAAAVAEKPTADELGWDAIAKMTAVAANGACTTILDFTDLGEAMKTTQERQEEFIRALAYLPENSIRVYSSGSVKNAVPPNAANLTGMQILEKNKALCETMIKFLQDKKKIHIELINNIKIVITYAHSRTPHYVAARTAAVLGNLSGTALSVQFYSSLATDEAQTEPAMLSAAMRGMTILLSLPLIDVYKNCCGKFDLQQKYLHAMMVSIVQQFYGNHLYAIPHAIVKFLSKSLTPIQAIELESTINKHIMAENTKRINDKLEVFRLHGTTVETKLDTHVTETVQKFSEQNARVEKVEKTGDENKVEITKMRDELPAYKKELTEELRKQMVDVVVQEVEEHEERFHTPMIFSASSSASTSPASVDPKAMVTQTSNVGSAKPRQ